MLVDTCFYLSTSDFSTGNKADFDTFHAISQREGIRGTIQVLSIVRFTDRNFQIAGKKFKHCSLFSILTEISKKRRKEAIELDNAAGTEKIPRPRIRRKGNGNFSAFRYYSSTNSSNLSMYPPMHPSIVPCRWRGRNNRGEFRDAVASPITFANHDRIYRKRGRFCRVKRLPPTPRWPLKASSAGTSTSVAPTSGCDDIRRTSVNNPTASVTRFNRKLVYPTFASPDAFLFLSLWQSETRTRGINSLNSIRSLLPWRSGAIVRRDFRRAEMREFDDTLNSRETRIPP